MQELLVGCEPIAATVAALAAAAIALETSIQPASSIISISCSLLLAVNDDDTVEVFVNMEAAFFFFFFLCFDVAFIIIALTSSFILFNSAVSSSISMSLVHDAVDAVDVVVDAIDNAAVDGSDSSDTGAVDVGKDDVGKDDAAVDVGIDDVAVDAAVDGSADAAVDLEHIPQGNTSPSSHLTPL